jgi:acylpyruvate hydrolase
MGNRNFNLVGKKIIGIGRNYVDHAKEMSSPIPKEPIFFLKPTSSYVLEPNPIKIPEYVKVDHEGKKLYQLFKPYNSINS